MLYQLRHLKLELMPGWQIDRAKRLRRAVDCLQKIWDHGWRGKSASWAVFGEVPASRGALGIFLERAYREVLSAATDSQSRVVVPTTGDIFPAVRVGLYGRHGSVRIRSLRQDAGGNTMGLEVCISVRLTVQRLSDNRKDWAPDTADIWLAGVFEGQSMPEAMERQSEEGRSRHNEKSWAEWSFFADVLETLGQSNASRSQLARLVDDAETVKELKIAEKYFARLTDRALLKAGTEQDDLAAVLTKIVGESHSADILSQMDAGTAYALMLLVDQLPKVDPGVQEEARDWLESNGVSVEAAGETMHSNGIVTIWRDGPGSTLTSSPLPGGGETSIGPEMFNSEEERLASIRKGKLPATEASAAFFPAEVNRGEGAPTEETTEEQLRYALKMSMETFTAEQKAGEGSDADRATQRTQSLHDKAGQPGSSKGE